MSKDYGSPRKERERERERDRKREGERREKERRREEEGERGRERCRDWVTIDYLPATETMLYFSMNLYSGPI